MQLTYSKVCMSTECGKYTSVIPATLEAEAGGLWAQGQPEEKVVLVTACLKNK
jgi:hypothetical protein